jgi:ankyrin repeat protein
MLDLLIAHRCNLKDRNPMGWTALHHAAAHGRTAMVEKLLAFKLSWKAQTKRDSETALHLAIRRGHSSTALALIRHKDASISMSNSDADQAIHFAVRQGDAAVTAALIENDAKIDAENKYGWTPILICAAYGHSALLAELIVRGESVETKLAWPDFTPSKKTNEAAKSKFISA